VHTTRFDPVQAPETQVSVCVHGLPSLQVVPSARAGFVHRPVPGSQVPAAWHWSCAVHVTGFEPAQIPEWHVSVCVQASPSLQVVPSGLGGFEHWPVDGSHVPAT